MPRVSPRLGLKTAAALACALAPGLASGEVKPLTLFQKTARAALVAKVRATSDSTRRPPMEVLEVLKGSYEDNILYVVPFFQDNANPKPWLQREAFRKGEEYFLFLDPYDGDPDDDAFPTEDAPAAREDEGEKRHLFVVLNANQGVVSIPAEGGEAIEAALRRFTSILAMPQYDDQSAAIRGLLSERNPYMVEAGLVETERFHLATAEDLSVLLGLTSSPRTDFRSGAARLLGDLSRRAREDATPLERRRELLEHVVALARADEDADVRIDAVRALAGIGGADAVATLKEIAGQDPSQMVRYAAEVGLLEISGATATPGARSGGFAAP